MIFNRSVAYQWLYVLISILQHGLKDVFDEAILATFQALEPKKRPCLIL